MRGEDMLPLRRVYSLTLGQFLGKEVPEEPFPRVNSPKEFAHRVDQVIKPRYVRAFRNCGLFVGFSITLIAAIVLGVREGVSPWKAI